MVMQLAARPLDPLTYPGAMISRLAAALVVITLAVGCNGQQSPAVPPTASTSSTPAEQSPPAPSADPTAAGAGCLQPGDDGEQARFGQGGRLAGYLLGGGDRYVVLGHQSEGDSCEMLAIGRGLAAGGYHVLALDFSGYAASREPATGNVLVSEDIVLAATYVRARGAESVAVVGASMGGLAALVAGTKVEPPLDAVVSLSAPDAFRGEEVPSLEGFPSPLQVYVGRDDIDFVSSARAFAREVPSAELFVLPVASHGVDLVDDEVLAQIMQFLDRQAA